MNKLREWMINQGLTQTQLALRLGVGQPYISLILSGERPITPAFVGRFAQAFGFDVAAEIFGNGDSERNGAQQAVRDSKETA